MSDLAMEYGLRFTVIAQGCSPIIHSVEFSYRIYGLRFWVEELLAWDSGLNRCSVSVRV